MAGRSGFATRRHIETTGRNDVTNHTSLRPGHVSNLATIHPNQEHTMTWQTLSLAAVTAITLIASLYVLVIGYINILAHFARC